MKPAHILSGNGLLQMIDKPLVMGIINVNSDSFFSGSRVSGLDGLVARAEQMREEGADILDIGAMSSRPGAVLSNPDNEAGIIKEAVKAVRKKMPGIFISVDTVWGKVAEAAIKAGANMINDISAGQIDFSVCLMAAKYDVPYVLMHMRGEPATMQKFADYKDVTMDLLAFFANKIRVLKESGVHQLIIDPGLGFSKTTEHNFTILKNLQSFFIFDKPVLVGLSRKSFIYKSLDVPVEGALNGTSVLHGIALSSGAHILRVHDVKEAREAVTLIEMLKKV